MEKLYTKITIIAVITFIVILLLGNEIIRFSFMSYTVNKLTIKQIEVMKSKFIAYIFPLNAEEDFKPILVSLRKEHKKARHIVYAYRINTKSKSCDDGEPKGTAGHPLLELLYKKDINNVALLVVRYFGGTLLGAGRLLRTYLQAGIEVINESELIDLER